MYIYTHTHTASFFLTLATGPRRSLSLELSDKNVYAPQLRARRTASQSTGHGVSYILMLGRWI